MTKDKENKMDLDEKFIIDIIYKLTTMEIKPSEAVAILYRWKKTNLLLSKDDYKNIINQFIL